MFPVVTKNRDHLPIDIAGTIPIGLSSVGEPPASTETWNPIGQDQFVKQVEQRLKFEATRIVAERHGQSKNGQRFFSLLELESDDALICPVLVLMNGHDKRLGASLAHACVVKTNSNLILTSVVESSRQNRVGAQNLDQAITEAVAGIEPTFKHQLKRVKSYQQRELDDVQAHDLIVQLYRADAIGARQMGMVVDEWHSQAKPRYSERQIRGEFAARNQWSFYNAVLVGVRQTRLIDLIERSEDVHKVLDQVCDLE